MIESHEEALDRLRENLANVVPGGTQTATQPCH